MNTLLLIVGPNGVGKSTAGQALHEQLPGSARLESEWCRMINPFILYDESINLTIDNITYMLRSYLTCDWLDTVIFTYGFHGPRRHIWESVYRNLEDIPFQFCPVTVTCSEQENIARMERDGRDADRIQRALAVRHIYDNLPYPVIDTTGLTIEQTVERLLVITLSISRDAV